MSHSLPVPDPLAVFGFRPGQVRSIRCVSRRYPAAIGGRSLVAVALYRDETGRWNRSPTEAVGGNDTQNVFEADSPGLSMFTIGSDRAVFDVDDAVVTADAVDVKTVTVDATVRNLGGTAGEHTVELRANDDVVATESVTLAANATRTVSFTPTEAGELALAVDAAQIGTVAVGSMNAADEPGQRMEAVDGPNESRFDTRWLLGLLVVAVLTAVGYWRRR